MDKFISNFPRRNFIRVSTLASLGIFSVFRSKGTNRQAVQAKVPGEMRVLFQGDSITDAGRERSRYYPNDPGGMGNGYVLHAVTELMGTRPDTAWSFYNRGISGNKVYQLAQRWEDDCLQLSPDVLSILIGVNDFWHTTKHGYSGTIQVYEEDYSKLLERTKKQFPAVKLIIGEPFAVKGGTAINEDEWFPEFDEYRAVAKKMAMKYGAAWIPYQQIFDDALKVAPVSYWCPDGVHPSMAGCYLMADAWMKTFYQIFTDK